MDFPLPFPLTVRYVIYKMAGFLKETTSGVTFKPLLHPASSCCFTLANQQKVIATRKRNGQMINYVSLYAFVNTL